MITKLSKNLSSVQRMSHLKGTMQWLAVAQDAISKDRGISACFHLFKGWQPSYPETTGYIINTFFEYGDLVGDATWHQRALEAGEWLLTVQLPCFAFPGGFPGPHAEPKVFNTGMILFGLAELAQRLGDSRFLTAGKQALDWLVENQDDDGSWAKASAEKEPHAYHSRVAWGMLEMARIIYGETIPDRYLRSVNKAVEWVCSQQNQDGWFKSNNLIPGLPPLTHNIAYILRGLVEVGRNLGQESYIHSASIAANRLLEDWEEHGWMSAGYDPGWVRNTSFRCLTGEAQMGIVWLRIGQITNNKRWFTAAEKIADQVAGTQWVGWSYPSPIYGAVAGAWPIWGRYLRFGFPNWAAKFYADLLMMLEKQPL